jgi:hypothetical protein
MSDVRTNAVPPEESVNPIKDISDDALYFALDRVVPAAPSYPNDGLEQALG